MKNNVFDYKNIFQHNWDNDDIVIWNNRKLIHTSTLVTEYNNKYDKRDGMFFSNYKTIITNFF